MALLEIAVLDDLRRAGVTVLDEGFSCRISRYFQAFMFYLYLLRLFFWLVADDCLAGIKGRIHVVNHVHAIVSDVALRDLEGSFADRDLGLLAVIADVAALLEEIDQ